MASDNSCKTSFWKTLKGKLHNLSPREFLLNYNPEDSILLDVRTKAEFDQCHMPNATHMDFLADGFIDQLENLSKQKKYFVYCRSGRRSLRVCTWMRNSGFDNDKIFNLDQGYADWKLFQSSRNVNDF